MRVFGVDNLLEFEDNLTGKTLGLNYRLPDPDEIVSFRNGGTKRVKGKLKSNVSENRLEHGFKILTGIVDGCFGKLNKDKKVIPISSDKTSDDYDKNWKSIVKKTSGDLVEMLGYYVFEASAKTILPGQEKPEGIDDEQTSGEEDPE